MDFFAAQELARTRTKTLVLLYMLTVSLIIVLIYAILVFFSKKDILL